MSKWNFIVDVPLCTNCNNCHMTIRDEYVHNTFEGYCAPMPHHHDKWIRITTRERGSDSMLDLAYLWETCNQCDNAPCMRAAQDGAVKKRADGIVIIDPVKARGQKQLVDACPYGHIWWNEELQLPQKWIWDAHLLDAGWKSPRPEQACGTLSIKTIKCSDEEMAALVNKEKLEVLRPELGTKPRIYYKNLYRYSKEFIAGSVATEIKGLEECVKGATVVLKKDGRDVEKQVTDYFGDFKFDKLEPNSGDYEIIVNADGKQKSFKHNLKKSVYLGAMRIDK